MSSLALHRDISQAIALPPPRGGAINIRIAVLDDVKFIDALQKKHSNMVGFLHLPALEAKIKAGQVLIAEEAESPRRHGGTEADLQSNAPNHASSSVSPCLRGSTSLGYCIFQDKYDKHDDCGIFYQVNIVPGKQRGLIGAALVKAQLERAAYGCKLACCWCAQDLEANYFWESLGFVPLAFRTGSRRVRGKDGQVGPRIHIFWQRRVRDERNTGETPVPLGGVTPYWFPSETQGGALRENRIVLPIPPGTHWSDAKPAVLPGMENVNQLPASESEQKPRPPSASPPNRTKKTQPPILKPAKRKVGVWFTPPKPTPEEIAIAKKAAKNKGPKQPRIKFRNDPKHIAAARELRDRYLEQFNSGALLPSTAAKYDVARQLEAAPTKLGAHAQSPLLKAA